jgi:photosystem II stability/assembly factor-like uncharacterized protein
MKADLSRDSFDPARHHSSVRLQQGRIVTDADWNEQADLTRHRDERLALDVIGRCGGPLDGAGYALVAETNAFAVAAVGADAAWVAAEDGALLAIADGGAGWALVDVGSAAHLRALAFSGMAGWLVGDGGTIRRTTDGGANWAERGAGIATPLFGVAATDADHAWVVGEGGSVLATADGGLSWTQAPTGASRLYAVDVADGVNGLAVGRDGAIVATHDGGATWAAVASGTTAHLRALARAGASRVCAAGDGGAILRSTDGGASWAAVATPTAATLRAIAFRDADLGWAAGDGGTLLATGDGGATWTALDAGTSATLRSLAVGGGAAWAVGDGGVLLRVDTGSPAVAAATLPAVNLSIQPGRYWAHGTLCELEARCSYAQQSDGGAGARLAPGMHLVYLDAWQRHLSALQAPSIREVALGGPDTATRARTLAQVRALALPAASPADWNCASPVDAWDALVGAPRPRMAARAEPQLAPAGLCEIAATAGYRRLENQLYRVEVHAGGVAPTFKWSRENGSVEFAVVALTVDTAAQQTIVRLAARGRDANLDLAPHDRVELVDDDSETGPRAGTLLEFLSDGDDELELVLAGVPAGALGRDPARHPLLRRWDQRPAAAGEHALAVVADTWIELEDGVQVRFSADGVYRPGDHWQVPARTISADVEWPRDADGEAVALPPAGIADACCRLALVEVAPDGGVAVLSDCRQLFPPLTQLEQLLCMSGDGQDGAPNAPLPQPLAVRVLRGAWPVDGAPVRFELQTGGGGVGPEGGPAAAVFETTTDAQGVARCGWTLGPGLTAPARHQRVLASLLDAAGSPVDGQAVAFCATASLALQLVAGDGQTAAAGATLPNPVELRVVHGGDGVAGVRLRVTVEQGGGSLTGPASVVTDGNGFASVGWRLGTGGPQRLSAQLRDGDGSVVQRVGATANVQVAATGGGGCEVTIGRGGDFERLDSELLAMLLERGEGMACVCFMPGRHEIDGLAAEGGRRDAAGPARLRTRRRSSMRREIALRGFAVRRAARPVDRVRRAKQALLLRDNLDMSADRADAGIAGRDAGASIGLHVVGAGRVSVQGCRFGGARARVGGLRDVSATATSSATASTARSASTACRGRDRSRDLVGGLRKCAGGLVAAPAPRGCTSATTRCNC